MCVGNILRKNEHTLDWRIIQYVEYVKMGAPQVYPTLPSSETLNNFCASTANSIGSLFNTSLQ
jgi:hypothetical protein